MLSSTTRARRFITRKPRLMRGGACLSISENIWAGNHRYIWASNHRYIWASNHRYIWASNHRLGAGYRPLGRSGPSLAHEGALTAHVVTTPAEKSWQFRPVQSVAPRIA